MTDKPPTVFVQLSEKETYNMKIELIVPVVTREDLMNAAGFIRTNGDVCIPDANGSFVNLKTLLTTGYSARNFPLEECASLLPTGTKLTIELERTDWS